MKDDWGIGPTEFKKKYINLLSAVSSLQGIFKSRSGTFGPNELLSLFLHLYKKTYSVRYVFYDEDQDPRACSEIKSIEKLLHKRFNSNGELCSTYIQWMFEQKAPELPNPLLIATLNSNTFINQHRAKAPKQVKIDTMEQFQRWYDQYKEPGETISKIDLYWIKDDYLDGSMDRDTEDGKLFYTCMKKAEELGILPVGRSKPYPMELKR